MTAAEWERLAAALDYPEAGPPALQETYVRTFDFDPDLSLDMGWHLYGDRPERGAFLAALRADVAAAGLSEGNDLADFLPTLLRLMARRDAAAAAELAGRIAPAAERLLERLRAEPNPFVEPLEAVVRALDASRQEARP
jgi:nitrate reductase assembly molybdenum cofactor insertion protein NarJ